MPIYEYHCDGCGDFEVTQRITEDPLTACPTCQKPVQRLVSLTSFTLKGGGWYKDLYGSSGSSGGSSASASAASTSDASSSGSAAATPAPTPAPAPAAAPAAPAAPSSASDGGAKKPAA